MSDVQARLHVNGLHVTTNLRSYLVASFDLFVYYRLICYFKNLPLYLWFQAKYMSNLDVIFLSRLGGNESEKYGF